ncbi:nitroreductase family protein [uncultured Megasphaera sp.]|uniref:nitroreductase family protein n=1 Tax=uncultured Megasphaera sp. TaxID=165188 RepID=UPI0025D30592|nr:nitroreductase family protein [uncultured Megasphaera sp.]
MMEKTVQQIFAKRRTNYTLGKDVTLSQEEITARIEAIVREVPSAFNMQSGRIIIAYGSAHDTIWQITKDTLRAVVPAEAFANTEKKIDSFAAAYGTILYYDDTDVVKKLQEQFPLYAANFPTWAQQANGMMQYALWTLFANMGLAANLQHYNPLIDEALASEFDVPSSWRLIAQMPFGQPLSQPGPIEKLPIDERVKIVF